MIKSLYALTIFTLFWSCSGSDSSNEQKAVFNNPINEAQHLIDKFKEDEVIRDTVSANQLIDLSVNRFDEIKDDPKTPEILIKTGEVAVSMMKYEQASSLYKMVLDNYPNDKMAPLALFYLAFNYDENLYDKAKAKMYYEQFLQQYPDHEYSSSVEELLLYIEKSPEEIYQELINRGNELINSKELNQNQ